jgi:CBS domain-containing protein
MQISDILARKGTTVTSAQEDDTLSTIVRLLSEHRVGALVIYDRKQHMTGIFSERDLVNALAQHGPEILTHHVSELMTRHVLTCTPEDRIDTVMARMTTNRIRHLPVLNQDKLAGIVSIGDLVLHRLNEKELEAGVLLDISRMRA